MQVEEVQRWVMSALVLTVAAIFAGGLALLAGTVEDRGGSRIGLLVIAAVVGVLAMAGVRVITERRILTPLLLLGVLPAAIGAWIVLGR